MMTGLSTTFDNLRPSSVGRIRRHQPSSVTPAVVPRHFAELCTRQAPPRSATMSTSPPNADPASRHRRTATVLDAYRALVTLLDSKSDVEFAAVEWRGLDVLPVQVRPGRGS